MLYGYIGGAPGAGPIPCPRPAGCIIGDPLNPGAPTGLAFLNSIPAAGG